MANFSLFKRWAATAAVAAVLVAAGAATRSWWLPRVRDWWQPAGPSTAEDAGHGHEGHDHGHAHADALEVSAQGLRNIGFRPLRVSLGDFQRTVRLPAMIVERPGRTQVQTAAPLTGIVVRILVQEGEAVEPGQPLFEIRLTHEELVAAQREFLKTAESLDVVNREIARLKSLSEGLIEGKRLRDEEYARQKLEASLKAERQGLLLHGLSEGQVDEIVKTRKLLQTLAVAAPPFQQGHEEQAGDHVYHLQKLMVTAGQSVDAGAALAMLADHCALYVEGRAFEDDAARLREALREGWEISARVLSGRSEAEPVKGLTLAYLADHVDPETRAFVFYLELPNKVVVDRKSANGQRYLHWLYRPGERLELEVPIETWKDRIVLPVDATVDEGAETFVFRQNGSRFERVPVHVEHRGPRDVVIANDGAVYPGDVVAAKGAYQMHLAMKNKAGGGIDPHAGHNH